MAILDAKDTEKCRKTGIIRVESAWIRVKVFRERYSSASRLDFVQKWSLQAIYWKYYKRQRKKFRNQKISELKNGGDKRDRTADLLNAMSAIRGQNEF